MLLSFPTIGSDILIDVRKLVIFGGSRVRRVICHLVAATMLFAHAVGVAQACIEVSQSPTMAFSNANHEEDDCEKTVNKNVCLQQYTAGNQSSAYAQVVVVAMPGLAVLTVPVVTDHGIRTAPTVLSLAHSPDPPRSIRFCSFQI